MASRAAAALPAESARSEEHTSELQSHLNLVCRLLLEKKKQDPPLAVRHLEQDRLDLGDVEPRELREIHVASFVFFFNDTATTEIYTLSLHDALPISRSVWSTGEWQSWHFFVPNSCPRSEEHTSELQSHLNLVCRLLLEKKKKQFLRTSRYTKLLVFYEHCVLKHDR